MSTPTDNLDPPGSLKEEAKYKYSIHPLAEKMPPMSEQEFSALVDDIAENGLLEPITLYQGMVLEGRHRYKSCNQLGYKFKETDFVALATGDPLAYVVSKNIMRRHLTTEQKRDLIKALLEEKPNASSRKIARLARVSPTTVEKDMEPTDQSGQLPQPGQKRTGADGKKRRAPQRSSQQSAKRLRRQIDDFISEWEVLNVNQKTTFVKTYKEELAEILEWVEASGDEAEHEAAKLVERLQKAEFLPTVKQLAG
jgi:hypothetical protein